MAVGGVGGRGEVVEDSSRPERERDGAGGREATAFGFDAKSKRGQLHFA